MSTTFTLTYPEFKEAWKAYVRYRTGRRDWVSPLVFASMFAVLAGMALYVAGVFGSRRPATMMDYGLLGLVAVYLVWRVTGYADGQYRALWRQMPDLAREQKVWIEGDRLRFQTESGLRTVELQKYRDVVQTPGVVILIAEQGGDILPKRALGEEMRKILTSLGR
jgi:hypothetical protein